MTEQNPPAEIAQFSAHPKPTSPSNRRWLWPAVVLLCGGGMILWSQRESGQPANVQTNSDVNFNFGQNEKTTPPESTSSDVDPAGGPDSIQAKAIIKGGITDLLNDHPLETAEHPMDPLLLVAEKGLENLRLTLRDYTATIERQERVQGTLMPTETISLKIRQGVSAQQNDGTPVARGIYTRHQAPAAVKGQEAIYVEGKNDGNLIAHTTGMLNLKRFYLPPTGFIAMRGSRYPMTEAGFEVLITRMLERGKRDRDYGSCEVKVDREATINGRSCTMFELIHPMKEGPYDFHIARIAIDDQLNLPIHYEAHQWPTQEGGEPELLERYTYTDIVINPGLPDSAFDPANKDYNFPAR